MIQVICISLTVGMLLVCAALIVGYISKKIFLFAVRVWNCITLTKLFQLTIVFAIIGAADAAGLKPGRISAFLLVIFAVGCAYWATKLLLLIRDKLTRNNPSTEDTGINGSKRGIGEWDGNWLSLPSHLRARPDELA